MQLPIYLDYAATTPVDPRVAAAMSACLTSDGVFANPASRSHIYGWQAEEKVELARRNVADLIGCDPREIVWTSGATESNNLALKGFFAERNFSGHLITSVTEHKAIIDPVNWLQSQGVEVTWLQPDGLGLISLDQVVAARRDNTAMVSIMHANNETGVISPIAAIGAWCRANDIVLHVDGAQSVGKIVVGVADLQVDMLSISAHKFYGPKGIGALYVKRPLQPVLQAQMLGGGHERGMRSGTLATHQIVGMGEAAAIAAEQLEGEAITVSALRDQFWQGIADLPGVRRNGSATQVVPGHLNVCFSGVDGETLLLSLRELAVSSGSACTSASMEPSYVLTAMGNSDEDAHSSIRFSLGRFTTKSDIEQAIVHVRQVFGQLKKVEAG